MTTIKIKSAHPASQGEFIVIDRTSFDPAVHELADGESLGAAPGDREPTKDELLALRDALVRREGELDEQFERVRIQAADNLAEAGRLAELRAKLDGEAAQLASDKAAFEAGKFATAPDRSMLTKEQLQAELDEKGIKYPAAATKAELHALLAS
jgi:hypothetical protein